MPAPRFDTYYRYQPLTEFLHAYAREYPQLVQIASIGKSHEGRDIWALTVTNFSTGDDRAKPAFYVDGNIHSAELASSAACLYLLHTLTTRYGHDADITRCLDERAFYIVPRVNPDGAEWALADVPKLIRSSTRPYPFDEDPVSGLLSEDIDGDGRILTMRIEDPNGHWKIDAHEPRLMVPRDPAETGGRYFRLLPEGRIENYDGALITIPPKKERLDLNRNFPMQWREEHEQPGAGSFPTSEPEVRALVEFIAQHKNICGGVAFHCYSGVLLRPFSHRPDEDMPPEDLWTFQKIGARGTELTGYPNVSAYHDFRYHPKEVITGALDDWLYDARGLFAWTVEIWSPQRQAGITDYKYIDWYREHPRDDDVKLLQWSDSALQGKGYIDWYAFNHPQLGKVELGGWNNLYSFWNPPSHLLEKELAVFPQWLVWHNLIGPRLEIHEASATALGNDTYRVRLVVRNSGWLPSYITKKSLEKKLTRGVIAEIKLPQDATLITGDARTELTQLEGRAYKPSSPFGWSGLAFDATSERTKVEWVVRAKKGTKLKVSARHERAGKITTEISLS